MPRICWLHAARHAAGPDPVPRRCRQPYCPGHRPGVDTDPAQAEALRQYNESGAIPYRVRRPDQVARFFDGLELAEPGLVPIHQWRPDPGTVNPPVVPAVGGVGRKP